MASIKYKDPKTGEFIRLPMVIIGGTGEDKTYVYTQNTASNVWVIKHDLNKLPSVTIMNSAGDIVFGNIHYDNDNQVTITFSAPFSGKATLN